jgi:hypothetical protein
MKALLQALSALLMGQTQVLRLLVPGTPPIDSCACGAGRTQGIHL